MRKYYEAYHDRYTQVHKENLRWFSADHSAILDQVISEFGIQPHQKLLEIGCGEGRDAAYLLERGYNLAATDVAPEAISFCRKEYARYSDSFRILDCLKDSVDGEFDFIYAIAVVHMLVSDEDRQKFYHFIRKHLAPKGIALICTMGDGIREYHSDISKAFALQDRQHESSGKWLKVVSTSYRAVSFPRFEKELEDNGLSLLRKGTTCVEPDYGNMMYAVVRKAAVDL